MINFQASPINLKATAVKIQGTEIEFLGAASKLKRALARFKGTSTEVNGKVIDLMATTAKPDTATNWHNGPAVLPDLPDPGRFGVLGYDVEYRTRFAVDPARGSALMRVC